MMQIFVPDLPEQSRKRQNSLFLEGLVMRIKGHSDLTWHHTIIYDSFRLFPVQPVWGSLFL